MKSRVWIIAGAFLLSGVLAVLLAILAQTPDEPSFQLADGTTFTLKAVTYGKQHSYSEEGWLKRLVRALGRFGGRPGQTSSPLSHQTTNDSITFWVLQERPNEASRNNYREFRLVDRQRITSTGSSWNSSRTLNKTQTLHSVGFESFPRRDDGFFLWVMKTYEERDRETPAAEFAVRNPGPRRHPTWTASPLPATVRDGDLQFTLVNCVLGESNQRRTPAANSPAEARTLLTFRVTESDQPTTDWRPVGVESWDATGNHAVNRSWSTGTHNDEVEIRYQDSLWPNEPAWKLRVEFSRAENFAPDELWMPGGISVAENTRKIDREETNPIMSTNLLGVTVGILGIEPGSGPNQNARLKVRMMPAAEGVRLTLVNITDETGRTIKLGGSGWSGSNTRRDYDYNLRDLDEAKSLRVTLAVHKSRYAEFLVQPELAR